MVQFLRNLDLYYYFLLLLPCDKSFVV